MRCHYAGQTNEQLKIELLSQWKLEAEFRKNENVLMNLYSEPLCPPFQTIKKREKGVTCWPHFVHSVHACSHRHKGKLGFCEAAANVHFEDWDL